MRNFITVNLILISFLITNAQNFGLGTSGLYNFQSESIGVGVRTSFFPNNTLSFVPQFAYYSFLYGTIHEYTIGLGLEYKIKRGIRFTYYVIAHAGHNKWLNYDESALPDAKSTNWNVEGGIGITTNSCLRPFLEYRYNIKFMETHLRFGLLYIFGCGGEPRTGGRIGGGKICPAYH